MATTPFPFRALEAPLPGGAGEAGAMILQALDDPEGGGFLARRAVHAVESLPDGPERRRLGHVLRGLEPGSDEQERVDALLAWAGHLESRDLLGWADEVIQRARAFRPSDPETLLHAARVARKSGAVARARELYDRVDELDDGSGRLARMAMVGRALVADEPGPALARALRAAVRAGDREAAAVALEARARIRRAQDDLDGALRDYAVAAVRFGHPADVGRIGHEVADVLSATGDSLAARRVLLAVERHGHPVQAERARARLLTLSRALGDELGLRRWADASVPELVSLTPRSRPSSAGASRLSRVETLLERLEAL